MDPENLPKKSYKQLCRDMGLTTVNEAAEHILGIIELYEYLKSSPFIGPFGTIENPVLVPSVGTQGFQGYGLSILRIRYLVPRMCVVVVVV